MIWQYVVREEGFYFVTFFSSTKYSNLKLGIDPKEIMSVAKIASFKIEHKLFKLNVSFCLFFFFCSKQIITIGQYFTKTYLMIHIRKFLYFWNALV